MSGEFGPSKVQIPFSLQDLSQIKEHLYKFSDDPDRYIEAFQNFTQIFEFSWRDVILLLNQALMDTEKQAALQAAERSGDELYITYSDTKGMNIIQLEEKQYQWMTLDGTPMTKWETSRRDTFRCV